MLNSWKKLIQVWNSLRVFKWWQNFTFGWTVPLNVGQSPYTQCQKLRTQALWSSWTLSLWGCAARPGWGLCRWGSEAPLAVETNRVGKYINTSCLWMSMGWHRSVCVHGSYCLNVWFPSAFTVGTTTVNWLHCFDITWFHQALAAQLPLSVWFFNSRY